MAPRQAPRIAPGSSSGKQPSALETAADTAFLTAKDALFNIADLITNGSTWAIRTILDCEKELDRLERDIDAILPEAISGVPERKARELLAQARMVTELERIGDLALAAANQLRNVRVPLSRNDKADLLAMAEGIQGMLEQLGVAREKRELEFVASVLRADRDIDRLRSAIFRRHLATASKRPQDRISLLFAAQALERAGDHATNIAEELYRLISGGTLRHLPARERRSKLEAR